MGSKFLESQLTLGLSPPKLSPISTGLHPTEVKMFQQVYFFQGIRVTDRLPDKLMTHIEFQLPG